VVPNKILRNRGKDYRTLQQLDRTLIHSVLSSTTTKIGGVRSAANIQDIDSKPEDEIAKGDNQEHQKKQADNES